MILFDNPWYLLCNHNNKSITDINFAEQTILHKEPGAKMGEGFHTYPKPQWAKPDFLKG